MARLRGRPAPLCKQGVVGSSPILSTTHDNERVADLTMTVTVKSDGVQDDGPDPFAVDPGGEALRVGDRVEVADDADDPNRFVYRPRLDL